MSTVGNHRSNNFDLIRLVAAVMVIFSHSHGMYGQRDALFRWTNQVSFGGMAVAIFLTISGYLIFKSWEKEPSLPPFLCKRALRILPALAVAVLVTILVFGPLTTSLTPGEYFRSPGTYLYLKSLLLFDIQYDLPGVLGGKVVNGPLWTLPLEVVCYFGVPLVWPLYKRFGRGTLFVLWVALMALYSRSMHLNALDLDGGRFLYWLPYYAPYFVAGMIVATLHPASVPRLGRLGAVGMLACLAAAPAGYYEPLQAIFLPCTVLFLGLRPVVLSLHRVGDLSYGLYIFAYPVQQAIAYYWGESGYLLNTTSTLLTVAPLAYVSWHLVESPCLELKKRLLAPRRVHSPAPPAIAATTSVQ